jgi:hypothetical protein
VSLFPYLAGDGIRLFDGLGQSRRLELVSATAFGNGTTELGFRRVQSADSRSE